jgi:hypothetical protein
MTIILKTKRHGEIQAGFLGTFTKLSRFGKYSVEPGVLYEMAERFAARPEWREDKLSVYSAGVFDEMEKRYTNSLLIKYLNELRKHTPSEAEGSEADEKIDQYRSFMRGENEDADEPVREMKSKEINEFIEKNHGKLSLEEKAELMKNIILIPVQVKKNGRSIKIGEYELGSVKFGNMVYYIARGGPNMKGFEFSEEILKSIEISKNPLYKKYNKQHKKTEKRFKRMIEDMRKAAERDK